MHFGKIPDMLWLSQVFENVNIADTLESTRYRKILNSSNKGTISHQIHVFNGPDVYLQSPFLFTNS
jgi:hypothetical protein